MDFAEKLLDLEWIASGKALAMTRWNALNRHCEGATRPKQSKKNQIDCFGNKLPRNDGIGLDCHENSLRSFSRNDASQLVNDELTTSSLRGSNATEAIQELKV